MQQSRIKSYIGFSIRMRKIVFGLEMVRRTRHLKLVLYTVDLGECAKKSLTNYCNNNHIPLHIINFDIGAEIGKPAVKIIGMMDDGLAKAVLDNLGVAEVPNDK